MDLDAPESPSPDVWGDYRRYKRWRDRFIPHSRARLSQRMFYYIQLPLGLAALGCMWWVFGFGSATRPLRMEVLILGCAFTMLLLLIGKMRRIH